MTTERMVLVSGIGYSNLSDLSFGRVLLSELEVMKWHPNIRVEDLNYGAIMIYQWFEESPINYDKAIFVHAAKRGRAPGTLEKYKWDGVLPADEDIQDRIAEAVTGTISLDNLLIVCKHFGVLPKEVVIVEIEPENENWGADFSPRVAARASEALELVRDEALRSVRHE